MKHSKIFSTLVLSASMFAAHAESELSVSAVDTFEDGGTVYAMVTIALSNTASINALAFDLTTPAGFAFEAISCTTRTQATKFGTTSDTWSPEGMNHSGYVSVAANGKGENQLAPGEGNAFILYLSMPSDAIPTIGSFMFNNASAALGGTREEVKFPIGKLGTNGYSSYSSSQDVIIEGATANYGTISGSTLTLSPVAEGEPIFHGEGVILKGTEGTTVYATSVATATRPTSNDVIATGNGVEVAANSVHVLSTEGGVTGFYLYTGTKIGAGKAYLTAPAGARIVIEEETGIDTLTEETAPAAIFNLQGQKMQEAKKGIQIVNGKKVMF